MPLDVAAHLLSHCLRNSASLWHSFSLFLSDSLSHQPGAHPVWPHYVQNAVHSLPKTTPAQILLANDGTAASTSISKKTVNFQVLASKSSFILFICALRFYAEDYIHLHNTIAEQRDEDIKWICRFQVASKLLKVPSVPSFALNGLVSCRHLELSTFVSHRKQNQLVSGVCFQCVKSPGWNATCSQGGPPDFISIWVR